MKTEDLSEDLTLMRDEQTRSVFQTIYSLWKVYRVDSLEKSLEELEELQKTLQEEVLCIMEPLDFSQRVNLKMQLKTSPTSGTNASSSLLQPTTLISTSSTIAPLAMGVADASTEQFLSASLLTELGSMNSKKTNGEFFSSISIKEKDQRSMLKSEIPLKSPMYYIKLTCFELNKIPQVEIGTPTMWKHATVDIKFFGREEDNNVVQSMNVIVKQIMEKEKQQNKPEKPERAQKRKKDSH